MTRWESLRPMLDFGDGMIIWRVPISVPCQAPGLPGTPDVSAPIEQRTERCAVDAYWMIGRAYVCDLHLRTALEPETLALVLKEYSWVEMEPDPWYAMYRYPQDMAQPDWEDR